MKGEERKGKGRTGWFYLYVYMSEWLNEMSIIAKEERKGTNAKIQR